jgi:hypothetical protein
MGSFSCTTGVSVFNKNIFKKGIQFFDQPVVNNPISKLSSKNLSFYRFCYNKSNTSTQLVGSISDIVGQFKNIFFKMKFKFQRIQRISFIPSTVKIGLKKCLRKIGL